MKKSIALLLALLLVFGALTTVAEPELEVIFDDETIEFPAEVADMGIELEGEDAFETEPLFNGELDGLELPDLTADAPMTAHNDSASEDFTIEDGVLTKYIGAGGDVVIPDGVTGIGNGAFMECASLTSVTIPNSVTSIGSNAFYNCDGLTGIAIPGSVASIGYSAFTGCSNLKSVTLGNGVESIDSWAFMGCGSLESIVIPDSVTSVASMAFADCKSLTTATIGKGVTGMENDVFDGCAALKEINVSKDNASYASRDGVLYSRDMKRLLLFPDGKTDVNIPEGVTVIEGYAFSGCANLSAVVIPDSVTTIGQAAFEYCTGLEEIAIPDSVTDLGNGIFAYCEGMRSVTLGKGMTEIPSSMFQGCKSLTEVEIPDNITAIRSYSFMMCFGLVKVVIPESVTTIEYTAFFNRGKNLTIHGFAGSCAEQFAQEYDIPFVTIVRIIGVKLDKTSASLYAGQTLELKATLEPEGIESVLTWSSSDEKVATVSDAGVVTALAKGTATITVATENGKEATCKVTVPEAPTGITLSKTKATLVAGAKLNLTARLNPTKAVTVLTWSSSNEKVATVTQKGVVKAIAKGKATITVKTANGKKATCKVTVPEAPMGIKLSKTKATLVVGAKLTLAARLNPAKAGTTLAWSSSNKKVATVTQKGVVKAIAKGTATITVKTANGKKATCKITVPAAPTKVAFAQKSYSVKVGKKITLKTKLTPAKAGTILTWSSSNKKIATVTQKGVVKGIRKGTVTITVKTANGKKATVKVTVE